MKNITSKVNKEDMENARIDRERSSNPADVEPGMGDFNWDGDDLGGSSSGGWGASSGSESGGLFGGSGGFGSDTGGGFGGSGGFGSGGFGSGGLGGGFGGGFGQTPPPEQKKDVEDKFWEGLQKFFSGFIKFTGEFVSSFKTFDVSIRMKTGKSIIITGVLTSIAGVILMLFGFGNQLGLSMLIGGLISCGVGVPLFMFSYDDYIKNGAPQPQPTFEMPNSFDNPMEESSFESQNTDDFGFDMFGDDEDEDFSVFDNEDISFDAFEESATSEEEIVSNMDNTIDSLSITNGMVTRQYLYDNIESCLMSVNKNFDNVRTIKEGSDEFDAWDAIIQNSAGVFKPKGTEIEMPYLITAKEKLFYVQLEIKRVNWIKNIDSFVTEIVNICRFDEESGNTDMSIYGIGNTVGDKIYVKIMKGETAMVTVRDAYKNVADEVKNSKNYMPVIIGLDAEGNVVMKDFKDINSILVTGMPRSGKTWLVQSILSQMMFFLKPSELNFYILDPKDQISDFKSMNIPHIRKFVSNDNDILKELRHIVKIEGPRRKKIIGDAGFVNIWDFKKRNPDVELPLLYVVIDEVITLAERMDRDTKDEFQALLLELVSQLPALGIRIFMIPHVVKDQILKKSITDLIPCRISVRGDADHIEKSVGAKNFKHKLFHQGDMALRFNNDEPMFVHSAVLTNSNEGNNDLFDFLLKFWSKLEPETLKGSLYEKRQLAIKNASSNSSNESLIRLETPSYKNNGSNDTTKNLSKNDVDDLLESVHEEINLWE